MRKWGLEANANRLFGWMMECEGQKHKLVRKKLSLSANSPYATREDGLDSIITNSKNKG